MSDELLTTEEKQKIDFLSQNGICKCGHKKNIHNRFINCMFVGCFDCDCKHFEWKEEKEYFVIGGENV